MYSPPKWFSWVMAKAKHHFKLDVAEREELTKISRSQKAAAIKVKRATALLEMDRGSDGPGLSVAKASKSSGLSPRSLDRLKLRVCESGPLGALERKKREVPPVPPKVTGEIQARIAHIACTDPPEGASRWTLKLIAQEVVELGLLTSISAETVRGALKKTGSDLG